MPESWDYLVLTASNASQANAYESQLRLRRDLGLLPSVREILVVPDLEGKRIGSGGSTLQCLALILNRERNLHGANGAGDSWIETALRRLRILILHAGGDSRRLPAYGPCGKIFVPVPGESHTALGATLFDRLAPAFLNLPGAAAGSGQTVVGSGDALIRFDSSLASFTAAGITALGCRAAAGEAARHGVFCTAGDGEVRLYLQKPSPEEQARTGAVDRFGRSVLDMGVMSFDGAASAALLRAFDFSADSSGKLDWSGAVRERVLCRGLDLYREICCAMGSESNLDHYVRSARDSGSTWDEAALARLYPMLRAIPLHARVLPPASFLHFGSTRQLTVSGLALAVQERGVLPDVTALSINNELCAQGAIAGSGSWVEGCRLSAPLTLAGRNVVVGADVRESLELPESACLDVTQGRRRDSSQTWFVRCYGVDDTFKDPAGRGATFCGLALEEWLAMTGILPDEVWEGSQPPGGRSLWNARVFPAESEPEGYRRWLWMYRPETATPEDKQAFRAAERYSSAEIAMLADQQAFFSRRERLRAAAVRRTMNRLLIGASPFSAEDLAFAMAPDPDRGAWAVEVLELARGYADLNTRGPASESFAFCRVIHTLGTAVARLGNGAGATVEAVLPGFRANLLDDAAAWLDSLGLGVNEDTRVDDWSRDLRSAAFRHLNAAIVSISVTSGGRPRNALRPDETIWGRGPARIELAGGWTDTPPYTLERGGDVANVAVNLNGQPPIHCYCRIVEEPVIRLGSIDGGIHLEIRRLEELLDYHRPEDRFALAKAALAIYGFSPEMADWPAGVTLPRMLEEFGGGIELTTLVGIPKGSGLGTSSILGAVIIAVLRRMMGRDQNQREIFHDVLRLEQALTTGGGWQDQIGGGVGGSKLTSTRPGLFADPMIHYVPSDVLDPKANGGSTLLYYTGITRLAKNILEQIVGGYLDRNRATVAALNEEHEVARAIAGAMSRKDAAAFGRYVNEAWELQKRLCGEVTNEVIESLLSRVRPHVHGMRISGAGSGGFLFMICKSPRDASIVREMLEREPLNERARFFDYDVNQAGLEVTTC